MEVAPSNSPNGGENQNAKPTYLRFEIELNNQND
jgi:hypothetical protein